MRGDLEPSYLAGLYRRGLKGDPRHELARESILVDHGVIMRADDAVCQVFDSLASVVSARHALWRLGVPVVGPVLAFPLGSRPGEVRGLAVLEPGGRLSVAGRPGRCWLSADLTARRRRMESASLLDCLDALREWEGLPSVVRWAPAAGLAE